MDHTIKMNLILSDPLNKKYPSVVKNRFTTCGIF